MNDVKCITNVQLETQCHGYIRGIAQAFAIGVFVFEFTGSAVGVDVNLAWDAPQFYTDGTPATAVASYRIYRGTSSATYSDSVDVPSQTSAKLTGLPDEATFFFSVTALATNGTESALSGELIWERRSGVPVISPSGGSYQDAVQIYLSTQTSGATIRYTTDGSTPTSGSASYSGPFTLTQSATVKAVAMKSGFQSSAVSSAGFSIATETTPPTLDLVHASGDHRQVILQFSEPVNVLSATTASNYEIIPRITVQSATIDPSMQIVTLHTSTLLPETTYTLLVAGIQDQSPHGNKISPTLTNFQFQDLVRTADGLLALYSFDELGGQVVHDESNFASPLDLTIDDVSKVSWIPGALRIDSSTKITSIAAPLKISQTCKSSNEFTIELWVRPSNVTQNGPARIATMSRNSSSVANFMVGAGRWGIHASDVAEFRLRTTAANGASTTTPAGSLSTALQHIVVTHNTAGMTKTYVDGVEKIGKTIGGTLDAWAETIPLVLANETDGTRPWLGEYHLIAIYGRALTVSEVIQNRDSGPEFAQTPQNPPPDEEPGPVSFLDANQNGMQDHWESENFVEIGLEAAPTSDRDQDGLSNLEEFLTGTDPTDGASYFGVKIECKDGAPNVSFLAARTEAEYGEFVRFYTLEKCDPVQGNWMPVPGIVRIPGADSHIGHVVPDSGDQCILFRAKTWLEHIPGDSDHNGLVDTWEAEHLAGYISGNAEATEDSDEDGLSNLQEFILGTDPTDGASYFGVKIECKDGAPNVSFLATRTKAEYGEFVRFYTLEKCDPVQGNWVPVPGIVRIPGADSHIVHVVPDSNDQCILFRAKTWLEHIPGDSDHNGLVDTWEAAHLAGSIAGNAEATADGDEDGLSNLQEFILGTDPGDPVSQFPFTIAMNGGRVEVSFFASRAIGAGYAGHERFFRLEHGDPASGEWAPVEGFDWILGNDARVTYVVPEDGAPCMMYRVAAWLASTSGDADQDWIQDLWEQTYLSEGIGASSSGDQDGDGLSNLQEFVLGTHPVKTNGSLPVHIEIIGGNPCAVFVATEANGPGYDDFTRYSRLEKQQGTGAPWIPVTGYDRITGDNSLVMCPMNSQEASCTLFRATAWLERNTALEGDADGDGILDGWESHYFSASSFDTSTFGDTDGDGFSNMQEFIYGSNPGDGTSYFSVRISVEGGNPRVTFSTANSNAAGYENLDRFYRLEEGDPTTGTWSSVPGYERIPAAAGIVSYSVNASSGACSLYRVAAWLEGNTALEGDADGDGILEGWESQYFSASNFDTSTFGDTDRDGLSNMQEFIYGTNPGDGTSYFSVRISVEGGNPRVTFSTVNSNAAGYENLDRFYRLEEGDPTTGTWSPVPGYKRIPATDGIVSYSINASSGTCSLYRVAAWLESSTTSSVTYSDNDGLPDTWEMSTFVLDGVDGGPVADPDGDHFSNVQEFVFGTDSRSGTSFAAVNIRFANGSPQVYFPTIAASGTGYDGLVRYYRLKKCISGSGTWQTVIGYEKVPGNGTEVQYNVHPQSNPCTLFGLEAWLESQ